MFLWLGLMGCAFEPVYGAWTYSPTTVDVDSCGLAEYLESIPANVTLEAIEGGVQLTDAEGHAFDCTLDGLAFTCPDRWPERVSLNNTQLEAEGEAHGAFDSETVARGSQSVTLDCIVLTKNEG